MPLLTLTADLVIAGICLGAALHHAQVAVRRRDPSSAAFLVLALIACLIEVMTALRYVTWPVAAAERVEHTRLLAGLLGGPALVLFLWTRTRRLPPRWMMVLVGVLLVPPLAHVAVPGGLGLRVAEVQAWLTPWGDTLAHPLGTQPVGGAVIVGVATVGGFGLAAALVLRHLLAGAVTEGTALGLGVALLLGAITHDALADIGFGGPPFLSGVGFLGLVAVGSWLLSNEVLEGDRARRVAERSELRLRTILDALQDGVVVLDASAKVASMNPAAERLLGPQARGRPLDACLRALGWGPDDVDASQAEGQVLRLGTGPLARRLVRLDARGVREGLEVDVVVLREITEAVRLRARVEAGARVDAVARLAAGTAHDFNNLLMVIDGAAEALTAEVPPDSEARAAVQDIVDATARASALTRVLLTFGRKSSSVREAVAMHPVIERAVDLLRRGLPARVRLQVEPAAVQDTVEGDGTQLEAVVINLVRNAIDAVAGEGQVTVRTRAAAGHLEIAVQDDGAGIPAEALDHVFDPFFTTKEPGRGTGLGLASVHGAVTAHGGVVRVRSTPGQGTTFTVRLPLAAPPRRAAPMTIGEDPHVLLVDDERVVRRTTRRVLEHFGCTVDDLDDGAAALERFRAAPRTYDVLVLDVVMPGLSGVDVLERARAVRADVPVVLITGYAEHAALERARQHDAVVVVAKPFRSATLAAALRRVGVDLEEVEDPFST